jgi:2-methylcitrate dehydratase PrpD
MLRTMSPSADVSLLSEGLGAEWHLAGNGHKVYPSASLTHAAVDAVLQIMVDAGASPVARIEAVVHPFAATALADPDPRTPAAAKFSLPFCLAAAAVNRRLGVPEFDEEALVGGEAARVRRNVRLVPDPTVGKRGAEVTVSFVDGSTRTSAVLANRGTSGNPVTDGELEEKFLALVEPHCSREIADEVMRLCWQIDEVGDVSELGRVLARPGYAA